MTITAGQKISAADVVASVGSLTSQIAYEQIISDAANFTNTDYIGADIFTDSNGAKNTVDTGTSTAIYDADNDYYRMQLVGDGTPVTENAEPTMGGVGQTAEFGYRVNCIVDCVLVSVTRSGSSNCNTAKLQTVGAVDIATASFSGNTATFSSPQEMLAGTTYRIVCDSGGGAYTAGRDTSASYPYNGTNINFVSEEDGTTTEAYNITSCVTQVATYSTTNTVETNEIIGDIVPDSIVVYAKDTLATDTSITVDVSDDGGSTFAITDQAINSYIDTTSFTGTSLALKFKLSTTDTSVTPHLFGYGVSITDV